MLSLLIIVIFIFYVCNTNKKFKKLKDENNKLRKQLEEYSKNSALGENNLLKNGAEKTEIIENKVEKNNSSNNITKEVISIQKVNIKKELSPEELKQKREKEEREKRNISILITGALFIVLAAIVFLTSTWNFVTNIVKTIVIFLLIGVFMGASNIAQKKLNLPKASKAFFYIAMAYIPICLISCSLFGLFGEYLSIYGEGKFIYLTLSLIITALTYTYNYIKKHEDLLLYGSILSQITAIILFTLIFEKSILLICINIAIYNILLIFIKEKINCVEEIGLINEVIAIFLFIISLIAMFLRNTLLLILLPILAINFILIRKTKEEIYSYILSTIICAFGLYLTFIYLRSSINARLLISLLYSLITFVCIDIICSRKQELIMRKASLFVNLCYIFIIYIQSILLGNSIIKPFMVSAIETILFLLSYVREKPNSVNRSFFGFLIPCAFTLTGIHLLLMLNANFYCYIIFALIILKIGDIKMKEDLTQLKFGFFVVSQIYVAIMYIISIGLHANKPQNLLIAFLATAYLIYNNFKQEENQYLRIIPELGLLLILKWNPYIIQNEYQVLLLILSMISFTIISLYKNKISVETIFSAIYLYATLNYFDSIFIKEIFCIIWSVVNVCFMIDDKEKDIFKLILYCAIFALFNSFIIKINLEYNSFQMIGTTVLLIVLLKDILKKYVEKDFDFIETIILFITYAYALVTYVNEFDGMIYVLFLIALLLFSYVKKYGMVFLVTLVAVVLNALMLTRYFWFSIPWWIYLLVIGAVLIAFAIKNESDETKGKFDVEKTIKKLKEKIEK